MARPPIPSAYYALVVARWEGRFLVIQERSRDNPWYLPAGRVEPGESWTDAALRETVEESGVVVRLTGLLTVEHASTLHDARVRVVFTAEPSGDPTPLAHPGNEHAMQAQWATLEEVANLRLRDPIVLDWLRRAAEGAEAPLGVLDTRGVV